MNKLPLTFCLFLSLPVMAHHSFPAQYDINQPVNLAGTVTDHHERSERETTTALDDLGDSVDVDDAGLAEAFATIARVVAFVTSVESHQNFSPPSRAASASAATRPW